MARAKQDDIDRAESSKVYKKPNWLIEAKYKSTIVEEKVMAVALASLENSKEDAGGNIIVSMRATDLKKIFKTNSGSFYYALDEAAKSMTGKSVGFSYPDKNDPDYGKFEYNAVVTHAEYGNGVFSIEFNHHLKDHIKAVKENYTLLQLQKSLQFKNIYSFRIYELMRSRCYPKKGEDPNKTLYSIYMDLNELKLQLGVVDSSQPEIRKILSDQNAPDFEKAVSKAKSQMYVEWKDFRDGVLKKACNEINKKSDDMSIEWTPRGAGKGGKVYGIDFTVEYTGRITGKHDNKDIEDAKEIDEFEFIDLMREFMDDRFSTKDLASIARAASFKMDKIKTAYEVLESMKGDVPKPTGFMIKAIKDDYKPPIKKKSQKSAWSGQFEQREIDFDELENQLLDN